MHLAFLSCLTKCQSGMLGPLAKNRMLRVLFDQCTLPTGISNIICPKIDGLSLPDIRFHRHFAFPEGKRRSGGTPATQRSDDARCAIRRRRKTGRFNRFPSGKRPLRQCDRIAIYCAYRRMAGTGPKGSMPAKTRSIAPPVAPCRSRPFCQSSCTIGAVSQTVSAISSTWR